MKRLFNSNKYLFCRKIIATKHFFVFSGLLSASSAFCAPFDPWWLQEFGSVYSSIRSTVPVEMRPTAQEFLSHVASRLDLEQTKLRTECLILGATSALSRTRFFQHPLIKWSTTSFMAAYVIKIGLEDSPANALRVGLICLPALTSLHYEDVWLNATYFSTILLLRSLLSPRRIPTSGTFWAAVAACDPTFTRDPKARALLVLANVDPSSALF